ncbi:MAG: M42 family metallopeptidase, partial [Chloroflexi bacterium]|nr:M42 family metallopeptidase [Chloroflexota bacterium]
MAKKMEAPKMFKPKMGKKELELLGRLTNALAVSGDEQEIRQIVMDELEGFADEMRVDHLGNVLVTKLGKGKKRLR